MSTGTVSDLVKEATGRGLGQVAVSRATWLEDSSGAKEVPVVGGRAVWEAVANPASVLFVVEQPNFFGRIEAEPPDGCSVVPVDRSVEQVGDARHLARSLLQVPGVRLPHGAPETSAFVVSLPGSPVAAARRLSAAGFAGCSPLGIRFPEFAGGLRVQVAWSREKNHHFCTILGSNT